MGEAAENVIVPEPGKVAIRDLDGSVSLVQQADLPAAQNEGARPATEAEYFGAKHGVAGDVAAGVVGAGRFASGGLFDPAVVGAARALGGDENAEEYRNSLRLLKQVSPNATLGGEVFGGLATAGLGGGGAGALEAGGSAIARFGARAAAAAPRAVAEGVGIGLGSQLSEDTLENRKLSSEAYLTAGIKGGALGLFLGAGGAGVLGAAGDKLSALAGRGERGAVAAESRGGLRLVEDGAPYRAAERVDEAAAGTGARKGVMGHLEDLRDQATFASTGATRKDLAGLGATTGEQAAERSRLANMLRTETIEGRPLAGGAFTSEREIGQNVLAKKREIGATLGPLYKEADAAAARPSLEAIREGMDEIRAKHAGITSAEELRGADRAFAKIEKLENPSHFELWEAAKKLGNFAETPVQKAALQEFKAVVRGELAASVDRAAAELGSTLGDRVRLNNQLYADLKTVGDVTARAAKRGDGGILSLKDMVLASPAIMSGHPAALAAVGLNVVRRKYGNQIAAHVLDTAAHMETVQRAASKLDTLLNDGTKAFVTGSKVAGRPMKVATTEEIRALREATRSPEAVTARVAEHLGDMPQYAPKTAQDIATTASRMAAWAQHALPKEQAPATPQFGKPKTITLSDTDRLKATAIMETMDDGSVVVDRLRQGRLTDDHVATLKFTQPETYAKIRTYLAQHATDLGKTMTTQQLTRLGMLFGEPLQEADLPENRRAFQASFSQGNQAPGQGGAGGNTGMAAMRAAPVPSGGPGATATQRLEAGTS